MSGLSKLSPDQEALGHAISGAGAGMFSLLLMYPLDTIKTRAQVAPPDRPSSWDPIGLYDGLWMGLVSSGTNAAVYYFFYSLLNRYLKPKSTISSLTIGSLAGALNVLCTSPLGKVHTKLQTLTLGKQLQKGSPVSTVDSKVPITTVDSKVPITTVDSKATITTVDSKATITTVRSKAPKSTVRSIFYEIYTEEGLSGFWSDLRTSLMLVVNPSITFFVFDRLCKVANRWISKLTPLHVFCLGALAKMVATVLTFPLIVAKARLQAQVETGKYQGITDVFQRIYRTKGLVGFFQGIETKLLQTSLSSALQFGSKEYLTTLVFALLRNWAKYRR